MVAETGNRQRVQILLPVNVWRKAKSEAALRGEGLHDLVAKALARYLRMEEDESPVARAG